MKILIVGAGALGGYFGGKLLQAGRDVTFLVRPGRADQLAATGGLVIREAAGDTVLPNPPLLRAAELRSHYDLVLLACKAGALEGCMRDMAPAVGPDTMILPVLNGMRHIETLADRFGRERLLGGRSFIFAALDGEGRVLLQGPIATIDFGELDGGESDRTGRVLQALGGAGFKLTCNPDILQGMWEKWVLIAGIAGSTCLMQAAIGDIVRAGALPFMTALVDECVSVAAANGRKPGDAAIANMRKILSDPDSTQSASMHKDMEKGLPIEADQIIGDLLARAPAGGGNDFPLLQIIDWRLKSYEARRKRELEG